jgi:hypothetical protein
MNLIAVVEQLSVVVVVLPVVVTLVFGVEALV